MQVLGRHAFQLTPGIVDELNMVVNLLNSFPLPLGGLGPISPGLPRHRENRENREFESPFFQTGKTQGIC